MRSELQIVKNIYRFCKLLYNCTKARTASGNCLYVLKLTVVKRNRLYHDISLCLKVNQNIFKTFLDRKLEHVS